MELLTLKEAHYENHSVGASIEMKADGNEFGLVTAEGRKALAEGFKPLWCVGSMIVGRRGDEIVLLADRTHVLGKFPTEANGNLLAYAGEFLVKGRVVYGRRIIISHLCKDLCDVLVLN